MSKINVLPVVHGHIGTLYDQRTKSTSVSDLMLFFGVPLLAGGLLDCIGFGYRTDAVNGFLNAFAILTGLLLNLLVLVFTLASTTSVTKMNPSVRTQLMREVFLNVCFCVVLALVVIVSAVVALAYMRSESGSTTGIGATFLLTASSASFVLTLLMVVKRMFVLMNKELSMAASQWDN